LQMSVPLVLDADALNVIAADAGLNELVVKRALPAIMTPHPAEAARLLARTTASVQSDRIGAACEIAARYRASVVLKGAGSICAHPDGTWFVTVADDRTARIWDAATGTLRRVLEGHTGLLTDCAIAPDGTWLATTGYDGTTRIWAAATGAPLSIVESQGAPVMCCAISPDGAQLATGSRPGTVRVYDVAAAVAAGQDGSPRLTTTGCAVTADGTLLAASVWDGYVELWQVATRRLAWRFFQLSACSGQRSLSGAGEYRCASHVPRSHVLPAPIFQSQSRVASTPQVVHVGMRCVPQTIVCKSSKARSKTWRARRPASRVRAAS